MNSSASLCLSLVLTCPAYNPGRLFIRGIFSKPSPSTEAPTFSQPCTASWHAASTELGPLEVEDSLLLRYSERERERAQFTKTTEPQIRAYIVPLLLPLPVCVVCVTCPEHVFECAASSICFKTKYSFCRSHHHHHYKTWVVLSGEV